MNRELIVNVTPAEISIALCEDKVLVELNKEQCQTGFSVGDIYLGKVRKIMPGLNAAFVNIGHEKDAFIHYLDLGGQFRSLQKLVASQQPGKRGLRVESMKLEAPVEKEGKIGDYLQVGQQIMVQVAKEAISTKGPRLTADISLAGRNVVLVPFSSKVFLSQKIRSAEEKKRLKRIAAAVLPKNFGVIIRTAAMEARDEDIEHDIQTQIDRWRKTVAAIRKHTAPDQLMSEMNRANTIIRDSLNGSFSQIAVDDEAMYNEIRNYIKQIDLAVQWPITNRLFGLFRYNYSLLQDKPIEMIGGVEYLHDCWTLRFAAQRYTTTSNNDETNFFLQLELNGLGSIGTSPLSELQRNIKGYQTTTRVPDKIGQYDYYE